MDKKSEEEEFLLPGEETLSLWIESCYKNDFWQSKLDLDKIGVEWVGQQLRYFLYNNVIWITKTCNFFSPKIYTQSQKMTVVPTSNVGHSMLTFTFLYSHVLDNTLQDIRLDLLKPHLRPNLFIQFNIWCGKNWFLFTALKGKISLFSSYTSLEKFFPPFFFFFKVFLKDNFYTKMNPIYYTINQLYWAQNINLQVCFQCLWCI